MKLNQPEPFSHHSTGSCWLTQNNPQNFSLISLSSHADRVGTFFGTLLMFFLDLNKRVTMFLETFSGLVSLGSDSQSCNIPQNVLNFSLFWCAQSERFSESNSDHHSDSSVFIKSTSDPVRTFFVMFHRFILVLSLLMFLLWFLLLSWTKFCRNHAFWFFKTTQHKAESVYHKRCGRTMSLNL